MEMFTSTINLDVFGGYFWSCGERTFLKAHFRHTSHVLVSLIREMVNSRLGIFKEPLSLNGRQESIFKSTPLRKTVKLRGKEP